MSLLCERHLRPNQLNAMDAFYPLQVDVCRRCWLVPEDCVGIESCAPSAYAEAFHGRRIVI
jgi:Putative zinc binding domain